MQSIGETDRPKTENIHNKRLTGMSRRKLMKLLSAAGFSAAAANFLTIEDVKAAASDEVPIPYAKVWDEKRQTHTTETKTVPADWYNDLQRAHNVHREANLIKQPGVAGTTVKPAQYGGRNTRIQVELSRQKADVDGVELQVARGRIPESIGGVPVDVVNVGVPKLSCYESDYGSSPPIGAVCGGGATLGPYMIKNGTSYFSTCHHVFGGDPTGEDLYQSSGPPIGEVTDYDCHDDFVAAEPRNGHTPNRDIVASSNYTWGHYTASGIDDLAAQGAYASKNGVRTCYTAGQIHGRGEAWVYDSNCIIRHDQVKWGVAVQDQDKGDSGAAGYHPYEGSKVLVLNINAAFVPKDDPSGDYVFGTGAYNIYNQYGFGF